LLTFTQQLVTGDSWGLVSIPVIEEEPVTAVFFAIVFLTTNLMILNVILSMVVESSLKAAEEDAQAILADKESEFRRHAAEFRSICVELDRDGSGTLSKREIIKGFSRNARFQELMQLMDFTKEDVDVVFNMLDKDGSGDLDYDEFVEELHKMRTRDSHTMLLFIKYYVSEIKTMMTDVVERRFTQLQQSLGVEFEDPELVERRSPRLGEPAAPVLEQIKSESVYKVMQEIRDSLRDEFARVEQDLAAHSEERAQLMRALEKQSAFPPAAPPMEPKLRPDMSPLLVRPPAHVPAPPCEEPPSVNPDRGCLSPARRELDTPGPLCHYVVRGRSESILRGGASPGNADASDRERHNGPRYAGYGRQTLIPDASA